ncbi:helix-turn-helix domain-containing protein [Rhizobium glycinendophyticum]|uniref:Helix-turn-helix transcriptional regulator n=1 Tax=Rhizobium glycinendophyticum TaxID=2589807 RepID=A0A504UAV3_9HYPH|nr:AraC family transcriptional regulator [Rhizobium glycinendophyticum]TPP10410.1 helix-turn-helix transcriptional regulator [Rhizobium glycinendophyticum]
MRRTSNLDLTFNDPNGQTEMHAAHSWRGVSVQYSRLKLPTGYEFSWQGDGHYLAHHDLVLVDGEMEVTGERPVAGGDLRDRMTFVPAGRALKGWAEPADRMNAFTVVCFDVSAMEDDIQETFRQAASRPEIYFRDEHLGTTMRKLGQVMADCEGPASRLYAETLGLTAALEMLRLSAEKDGKARERGAGQLSNSQRSLVTGFIETHLADDIGLDELASLCGLSRFHFCRAFKATFGETPIQYVTLRRIEKAQQMLGETRMPVAMIAKACGFSGASQFGRAFRSVAGTTPLAFRRSI